jgi:hypothetical protein
MEDASEFGEPIEHRDMEEIFADLLEFPISRVRNALTEARVSESGLAEPISLQVGYLSKPTLNAFARKESETDYEIRICSGTVTMLLQACRRLASRLDPQTGRPVQKNDRILVYPERKRLVDSSATANATDLGAWENELTAIASEQLDNPELGLLLFELSTWFIAMHEVMHIVLGHAGFLREQRQLDPFVEFSKLRQTRLPHDFSQMLEFAADRNASRGILRRLTLGDLDWRYGDNLLENVKVDRPSFWASTFIASLTLLLHLFPKRFCSIDRLFGSHPHPYTRMQWMTMELGTEFDGEIDYKSGIMTPLAEVSAALRTNFICPDDWWEYAEQDLRSGPSMEGIPKTDLLYRDIVELARSQHDQIIGFAPVFRSSDSET